MSTELCINFRRGVACAKIPCPYIHLRKSNVIQQDVHAAAPTSAEISATSIALDRNSSDEHSVARPSSSTLVKAITALVATGPQQKLVQATDNRGICRRFAAGQTCMFGKRCHFKHELSSAATQKDEGAAKEKRSLFFPDRVGPKTALCPVEKKGNECSKPHCIFRHEKAKQLKGEEASEAATHKTQNNTTVPQCQASEPLPDSPQEMISTQTDPVIAAYAGEFPPLSAAIKQNRRDRQKKAKPPSGLGLIQSGGWGTATTPQPEPELIVPWGTLDTQPGLASNGWGVDLNEHVDQKEVAWGPADGASDSKSDQPPKKINKICRYYHADRFRCKANDCKFLHDDDLREINKAKALLEKQFGVKVVEYGYKTRSDGSKLTTYEIVPRGQYKGEEDPYGRRRHGQTPDYTREFKYFPQLPTELRLKVWEIVLVEPYRTSMRVRTVVNWKKSEYPLAIVYDGFVNRVPVPALLHVNVESRIEALKQYQLAFGSRELHEKRTYINPKTTEIYFNCALTYHIHHMLQMLSPDDRAMIQHFSMKAREYDAIRQYGEHEPRRHLNQFPNLKVLTIYLTAKEKHDAHWRKRGIDKVREDVTKDLTYGLTEAQAQDPDFSSRFWENPEWKVPELRFFKDQSLKGSWDAEEFEGHHSMLIEEGQSRKRYNHAHWTINGWVYNRVPNMDPDDFMM